MLDLLMAPVKMMQGEIVVRKKGLDSKGDVIFGILACMKFLRKS